MNAAAKSESSAGRSRKVLPWRREDSVTLRSGDYTVNKISGRYDAWLWPKDCGMRWSSVAHETQREAIAACERHAAAMDALTKLDAARGDTNSERMNEGLAELRAVLSSEGSAKR